LLGGGGLRDGLPQAGLFALLLGLEIVLVAGTSAVDELLAGLGIHIVGVAVEQGETAAGFLGLVTVLGNLEVGLWQGLRNRGILRLLDHHIRGSCPNSGCQQQNSRDCEETEAISEAHFDSVEWLQMISDRSGSEA